MPHASRCQTDKKPSSIFYKQHLALRLWLRLLLRIKRKGSVSTECVIVYARPHSTSAYRINSCKQMNLSSKLALSALYLRGGGGGEAQQSAESFDAGVLWVQRQAVIWCRNHHTAELSFHFLSWCMCANVGVGVRQRMIFSVFELLFLLRPLPVTAILIAGNCHCFANSQLFRACNAYSFIYYCISIEIQKHTIFLILSILSIC